MQGVLASSVFSLRNLGHGVPNKAEAVSRDAAGLLKESYGGKYGEGGGRGRGRCLEEGDNGLGEKVVE